MNWSALNERLCGVLINFSLKEGLVLFLKERTGKRKEYDKERIENVMKIGNYLTIYLEEELEDPNDGHTILLGRLKDLYWKSRKALEEEFGVPFENWQDEGIRFESTSVVRSSAGDTMPIPLSRDLHIVGKIDFLGVPKKTPYTWMKVFEAKEEDVKTFLDIGGANTGFKIRIGPEKWVSVDFQEKHFSDNILIIGSYGSYLSLVIRQMLEFSHLPKIIFTRKADTEFSDFDKISIREFQRIVANGFGFRYFSDEQILNAATSLNPPQIRLLSNLLAQAREEGEGKSKIEILKRIVANATKTSNNGYPEDLEKIFYFLEARDKNLNTLLIDNKTTIIDVSDREESKQIVFSRFLSAVQEEIDNRKREKASLLKFLLFVEDIEDYVPSSSHESIDSGKSISKETFGSFISHPNTKEIGLIMNTRFPSLTDPIVFYLCPNRLFGEVIERRELMKIKEVFGIEDIEIRKLRNLSRRKDESGILLNFPSRFPADVVDGILAKDRVIT